MCGPRTYPSLFLWSLSATLGPDIAILIPDTDPLYTEIKGLLFLERMEMGGSVALGSGSGASATLDGGGIPRTYGSPGLRAGTPTGSAFYGLVGLYPGSGRDSGVGAGLQLTKRQGWECERGACLESGSEVSWLGKESSRFP